MASHRSLTVGLISDTHGLLRPEAVEVLRGSDFIVHAGDIGGPEILAALSDLAPLTAIRGNNDTDAWATRLPDTEVLAARGTAISVIHNLADLDLDPAAAGFRVVVSGHSHRPGWRNKGGVLYVNPGSAGPRRFSVPVAAAQLVITGGRVVPKLFELQIDDGG